jgi:hypothetical protein
MYTACFLAGNAPGDNLADRHLVGRWLQNGRARRAVVAHPQGELG